MKHRLKLYGESSLSTVPNASCRKNSLLCANPACCHVAFAARENGRLRDAPPPLAPSFLPGNDLKFVDGQREGAGRFTAKTGLVYVGEWRAGRMTGVGQSTDVDETGKCVIQ